MFKKFDKKVFDKKCRSKINIKYLLIAQSIINSFLICWFIFISFVFTKCCFPERFFIHDMTFDMISTGQSLFLVSLYLTLSLVLCLYITSIVLGVILSNNLLWKSINKKIKLKFMVSKTEIVFSILITFLNFILPIIFSWIFLFTYKYKTKVTHEIAIQQSFKKYNKIGIKTISISSVILICLPFFILGTLMIKDKIRRDNVVLRTQDLQQAYTLSSNHNNTIVLYFDRGLGLLYNLLFYLDYIMFKDKSFIQQFPEFTSYINVLSLSSKTNGSNPSLKGGWNYNVFLKGLDIWNKNENIDDKNLTMDDWTINSYYEMLKVFEKNNYSNFGILDTPYYGYVDYQNNFDSIKFQKELNNKLNTNSNLVALDATEITKASTNDVYDVITNYAINCQYFGTKTPKNNIDLIVDNNLNHSSFIYNHFYVTHQTYSYVSCADYISEENIYGINYNNPSDGKIKKTETTLNTEGLLVSIWYSIQKLKSIFLKLKFLPATTAGCNNQYENTNIYIIADHGNSLNWKSKDLKRTMEYLVSKNILTNNQYTYLKLLGQNNTNPLSFNPVFLFKPAKFKNNTWNKNVIKGQELQNFYNTSSFLTLADLLAIFDANLQANKIDKEITSNNFIFDPNKSLLQNYNNSLYSTNIEIQNAIQKYVNNNFVLNPLEQSLNILNKRSLLITFVEWHYLPNAKKFKTFKNILFNKNNEYVNSIFDKNLWTESSI